mmetsp:Transcript_23987/g.95192  ORF Transcript_23987/g.95192 Transcript_23987/m.95192 type:complete len:310 (+) Transcript_23987:56-985(+)
MCLRKHAVGTREQHLEGRRREVHGRETPKQSRRLDDGGVLDARRGGGRRRPGRRDDDAVDGGPTTSSVCCDEPVAVSSEPEVVAVRRGRGAREEARSHVAFGVGDVGVAQVDHRELEIGVRGRRAVGHLGLVRFRRLGRPHPRVRRRRREQVLDGHRERDFDEVDEQEPHDVVDPRIRRVGERDRVAEHARGHEDRDGDVGEDDRQHQRRDGHRREERRLGHARDEYERLDGDGDLEVHERFSVSSVHLELAREDGRLERELVEDERLDRHQDAEHQRHAEQSVDRRLFGTPRGHDVVVRDGDHGEVVK